MYIFLHFTIQKGRGQKGCGQNQLPWGPDPNINACNRFFVSKNHTLVYHHAYNKTMYIFPFYDPKRVWSKRVWSKWASARPRSQNKCLQSISRTKKPYFSVPSCLQWDNVLFSILRSKKGVVKKGAVKISFREPQILI